MNDITFLKELEERFNNLEMELNAVNKLNKVDPAMNDMMKKIDNIINDFHNPKLELVELKKRLIDY